MKENEEPACFSRTSSSFSRSRRSLVACVKFSLITANLLQNRSATDAVATINTHLKQSDFLRIPLQ